ncbi:arylamine N-acetyltransferase family protein [Salinibaculum salinum]|uniref:arylamine N-acetyltransferase family protein n=1 Tax=Salinibaculum salinum TaxID=3131996 RepID=UPI0030ECE6AF
MDVDRYLSRIGLNPDALSEHSVEGLARIQRAHVRSVPFENLSITGDPFTGDPGEGVTLSLQTLYQKIVEDERGGYCFELNGLFGWLLAEGGFEADRIAARVLGEDGDARPPANHHAHVVTLDRRYLVDAGLGVPTMRQPLPLDGSPRTDEAGVTWRVVESDRPDADYLTQFRMPGDDDWTDRYVFRERPRELAFFEATCEYLASAPESPFTGAPVVSIATADGHKKLSRETLTVSDGETTERPVAAHEWHDVLETEFGLRPEPME